MVVALSYESCEVCNFYFMEALKDFWKRIRTRRRNRKMETIVLCPMKTESVDVSIKSRYREVVLEKAFNNNLVIQQYKGREKKIMIFVPLKWDGNIKINTVYGNITCNETLQKDNLVLDSKRGKIQYVNS